MANLEIFDDSLDEGFLEEYRKKRIAEIKTPVQLSKIKNRDILLQKITTERCIVHFYKQEFEKCKIMNERLHQISTLRKDISFYMAEAEDFPDICSYLHITVLPFLGFFKDGKCVDSVIGFEGLGENDFKMEDLLEKIKHSEI
ncbi:ATP binding protein [Pseudoloma neurophilia]|uniref:ATP binding protein n=1 Tax=Pseudoloma neurophilia TaxID=146866 RepID=A0A0R0LY88_9MICR|nr:ATP binding protein [Pseudoloma neurophilia]